LNRNNKSNKDAVMTVAAVWLHVTDGSLNHCGWQRHGAAEKQLSEPLVCVSYCVAAGAIATPLLLDFVGSGCGDTVRQLTEQGAKLDDTYTSSATAPAGSASSSRNNAPDVGSLSLAEAPAAAEDQAATGEASQEEKTLKVPLRRVGQAEEIASCVVWLCMHGQYVTGTDVLVDGGSSCRVLTSSD
jgi:NAD(P)-dependent dehydrogenase (short-subunit alcohol dehydrogenase family)